MKNTITEMKNTTEGTNRECKRINQRSRRQGNEKHLR